MVFTVESLPNKMQLCLFQIDDSLTVGQVLETICEKVGKCIRFERWKNASLLSLAKIIDMIEFFLLLDKPSSSSFMY